MAYVKEMRDLYHRLRDIGLSGPYVKNHILPHWWDDSLAKEPSNRRIAELSIAKFLGIPLPDLVDREAELRLDNSEVKFKKWVNADEKDLSPTVAIAYKVARLALFASEKLAPYSMEVVCPEELRASIIERSGMVDLEALLDECWDSGVPVIYLDQLPKGSRRIDGLILLVNKRPVILLSRQGRPSKLTWFLAHEMGHASKGHVSEFSNIDENVDTNTHDEEQEANDFAKAVIYEGKELNVEKLGFGNSLSIACRIFGARHKLHPASVALIYGRATNEWARVERALKELEPEKNGMEIVNRKMLEYLNIDKLAESEADFLLSITGAEAFED